MSGNHFVSVLGKYFGEPELAAFLEDLGIVDKPKLARGDFTAHLCSLPRGVELTFRVSDALKVKLKEYPEGALVLSNVAFYLTRTGDYLPFDGDLPLGIASNDKKPALISKLGKPNWTNPQETLLRWDMDGFCIFASLDSKGGLEKCGIQLPVVKA